MRTAVLVLISVALLAQGLAAGENEERFDALVEVARSLSELGNYFSATGIYEEALSLPIKKEEKKLDILYELADLLSENLADTSEAIAAYLRIAKLYEGSPRTDVALYRVGLLLEEQGQCYNAVSWFEKVIVEFPESRYAEYALQASERCFQKNFKEAAAVVDGKPITIVELEESIAELPIVYRNMYSTPEGKNEYLEKMVKDRIVELYARERGTLDDPSVQGKLQEAKMRILNEKFFLDEVRAKVKPTEEEIVRYYEEHREEYVKPEEVRASHILVETEEEAQKVLQLLKEGKDFADLASDFSIDMRSNEKGGDLGYITRGRTVKEVEEAAFSLEPGQTSGVVKSRFGYHIVRVTGRNPETYRSLEAMRDLVGSEVRRIKEEERSRELMEELRRRYDVRILAGEAPEDSTGTETKDEPR